METPDARGDRAIIAVQLSGTVYSRFNFTFNQGTTPRHGKSLPLINCTIISFDRGAGFL